jgi:DNA (cytosine-5)-methyltransferase 1
VKLGGLFSGIGGFELAWTQLGHEVAWLCEYDPHARKVLAARFPNVPIYPDVRDLDPAEVQAVDVVTGGSPCQGFSIAGQRTGLEHSESQLFADYVRIVNGLAQRGLQWALWENVPGVLSIQNENGEFTYEHVVAALVGATEPVRLGQGRWNTGLADGGGRAVAWRVLDSRYFGVAQRRRRVFACVAFGGAAADRAGRALLAKPTGLRGDFAAGRTQGEGATGGFAGGAAGTSIAGTVSAKWAKGTGGPSGDEAQNLVTDLPIAFRKARRAASVDDDETWVDDGEANTLSVFDSGESRTTHAVVRPQHGVRRLTPVECERLQAFPDAWTQPAGSDSARYRALGNAVTVNTVRWVLGRMLEQS